MNDLCEDIQRHIVGFCDSPDVESLSRVSSLWPAITASSKLHYDGPFNGHTFAHFTVLENGPCYMPFVQTIFLDAPGLEEAIGALHLGSLNAYKKKSLELVFNLHVMNDAYCDFINAHEWASVVILSNGAPLFQHTKNIVLHTKKIVSTVLDYGCVSTVGLEHLILSGFDRCTYSQLLLSLFSLQLTTLRLYGALTDTAVLDCASQRMPSLRHLYLHNEGICDWGDAKTLQRMFPNLESFSIQTSNLLRSDLPNFDFALWPNLKSLNFEKNHALELTNYPWPKTLETLRIVNCGLNVLPDLPNLKDFSWTVAPEWLSFFLPVVV